MQTRTRMRTLTNGNGNEFHSLELVEKCFITVSSNDQFHCIRPDIINGFRYHSLLDNDPNQEPSSLVDQMTITDK